MKYNNITPQIDTLRLAAPVAAGVDASRVALPEIDMQKYPAGCRLVLVLGAVVAGGIVTLRAKGSETSGTYGAGTIDDIQARDSDLVNQGLSVVATNPNNGIVILEVIKPIRRYLRFDYQRTAANATIEAILVEGIENDRPANPAFDKIAAVSGHSVV